MSAPTQSQQTAGTAHVNRWSIGARLLAAVALAVVMLAGILVLGRVASSDVMAMALTSVFFVLLAGAVGWLVWRRRELLVPLGATFAVVAGGAGILLGLPLITDEVVEEDVIRVESGGTTGVDGDTDAESGDESSAETGDQTGAEAGADSLSSTDEAAPEAEAGTDSTADDVAGPTEIASGTFEARDHPGEGTATLIDTGDGTVLTLTDFATDNGPDLLVYLVPADAPDGSVEGFVDLGPLRGNIGDQQYDVPAEVDAGAGWRVVVWCRAFAVNFTEATLS